MACFAQWFSVSINLRFFSSSCFVKFLFSSFGRFFDTSLEGCVTKLPDLSGVGAGFMLGWLGFSGLGLGCGFDETLVIFTFTCFSMLPHLAMIVTSPACFALKLPD